MISKMGWTHNLLRLAASVACVASTLAVGAQVQTETDTTSHPATVETTVERGEVVYVNGNDLIIRMEDGSLRHFSNVPESARAIVDGKEIGIHDVKIGMKLQKTITTTTTPKTVKTVQTVTGKVWHISPPNNVVLTLENGTNQEFKIPKDQKFNVDGEMKDAWGLKKGMKITATKIVESPEVHVSTEKQLTGSMPPPPPPPPSQPILVAAAVPPAAPATTPAPASSAVPATLPKTASSLPLIGLLGVLALSAALGLKATRAIM